jgi:hypothetical protein
MYQGDAVSFMSSSDGLKACKRARGNMTNGRRIILPFFIAKPEVEVNRQASRYSAYIVGTLGKS